MKKIAALCLCALALCLCAGCAGQAFLPQDPASIAPIAQSGGLADASKAGAIAVDKSAVDAGTADKSAAGSTATDAGSTPNTGSTVTDEGSSATDAGLSPVGVSAAEYQPYFNRLDATEQLLYQQMYSIAASFAESGPLTPAEKTQLDAAFLALCADHPELFWLESYHGSYTRRNEVIVSVEFRPGYSMTAQEKESYAARLAQRTQALLEGMAAALPANAADADKAQYLFAQITSTTCYDPEAPHSQSLISCLVEGRSLCAGYARALQYLLNTVGIPCAYVAGTADGQPHAWDLALLDGSWYHMDPTWGDSDTAAPGGEELIHHEYFAMTDAQLAADHSWQAEGWPACTDEAATHFVRSGTKLESWDTITLENLLREAARQNRSGLCLELATPAAWEQATAALGTGELYRLLRAAAEENPALAPDTLQYFKNEARRVLHIVLSYDAARIG